MNKEETSWHDYMKQFKPDITLDEATYILWNETCYPFDDETTIMQIKEFFSCQTHYGTH